MANEEHLAILKSGVENWNKWRLNNISIKPDLGDINLTKAKLPSAIFAYSYLSGAVLKDANLYTASLTQADLSQADLSGANLIGAKLGSANLYETNLSGANLQYADLQEAILKDTNLTGANLRKANLQGASCLGTNFKNAIIDDAKVYGTAIWNIQSDGLLQKNLIITGFGEPIVTVDNIEVAQFIYLILNNQKLRDVIGTIAKKGVLILGRFTPDRKKILDAIRDKLRYNDFVPIMFDFEKASERDFTETIKLLAGMSRFVIADITKPKSSPLELQALIPDYKIPFVTIIQKDEEPFSMFHDLEQYPWVLPPIKYGSEAGLLKGFQKGIIDEALKAEQRILEKKNAPTSPARYIEDFVD